MEEVWRDIPGYEGRYQVSDMGGVKSLAHTAVRRNTLTGGVSHVPVPEKILKPQVQKKSGHLEVKLGSNPAQHIRVHTLVMLTFVGPRPGGLEVCHNDSDPTNNRLSNLRYDTRSSNRIDMVKVGNEGRQILTVEDVHDIRDRLRRGESCSSIARTFGVHKSTISKIKSGKNFAWLTEEGDA